MTLLLTKRFVSRGGKPLVAACFLCEYFRACSAVLLRWRGERRLRQKICNLMYTLYMLKVRSNALHPMTNCSILGQLKLQTLERIAPMSALPHSTFRRLSGEQKQVPLPLSSPQQKSLKADASGEHSKISNYKIHLEFLLNALSETI